MRKIWVKLQGLGSIGLCARAPNGNVTQRGKFPRQCTELRRETEYVRNRQEALYALAKDGRVRSIVIHHPRKINDPISDLCIDSALTEILIADDSKLF